MSYGDGSIREVFRKDGSSFSPKHWRIRLEQGTDPITGKKLPVISRTVVGTKTQARKIRDSLRADLEGGIKLDANKLTFRELANEYQKSREDSGKLSDKRLRADRGRIKVLNDLIGNMKLRDINVQVIESLYPRIREHRLKAGWNCGNTTLHSYYTLLKAILKRAVRYSYISSNPCDFVEDVPGKDPTERNSLTIAEGARLLKCIDKSESAAIQSLKEKEQRQKNWKVEYDRSFILGMKDVSAVLAVRLGLATGMRLSEVLGRTWGDLYGNILTVRRSTTKTDAGARKIHLDESTLVHLEDWRTYQRDLLSYIGINQNDETPILCTATGSFINVANFETWWRSWRTENGFEGLLFHELRHTQATQLLANGMDIKTVQSRLGHSDPSLTLKFYAHAMPDNDQQAADLIGDLFAGRIRKQARIIDIKTA